MSKEKPKSILRIETKTARTSHHVCFHCRKQFQKPVTVEVQLAASGKPLPSSAGSFDTDGQTYSCPQCEHTMTHVGKNFRAPRQADVEAWKVAEQLIQAGWTHSHAIGMKYPTRLKDVPAFLYEHKRRSVGEELLRQWRKQATR